MELLNKWEELTNIERTKEQNENFWKGYLRNETNAYEMILTQNRSNINGNVADLAKEFEMDSTFFVGFLDGINSSLNKSIDLESLSEDTELEIDIDFEKLYFNMLKAKAYWLYDLEMWDNILTDEKRNEIKRAFRKTQMVKSNKVGRNDFCVCGSGKKYKKCCLSK